MKKISEAEVIYDAFMDTLTKKLPKDEKDYPDWYKERLDKCSACKFNTKNIPASMLPLSLYVPSKLGKHRCSICTCFIKQKCWSQTEQCSLGEGLPAPSWMKHGYASDYHLEKSRWNRLKLITMDSDEFNIISKDDKSYNVELMEDGSAFVLKLNPVKEGNNMEFSFGMESKHDVVINATHSSCGCTSPKVDMIDVHHNDYTIMINTSGFGIGTFRKSLTIQYEYPMNKDKGVHEVVVYFEGEVVVDPDKKPKEDVELKSE